MIELLNSSSRSVWLCFPIVDLFFSLPITNYVGITHNQDAWLPNKTEQMRFRLCIISL